MGSALPYIIATFPHFLLGDIITGTPALLYGVYDQTFGAFRPWFVTYFGDNSYGTHLSSDNRCYISASFSPRRISQTGCALPILRVLRHTHSPVGFTYSSRVTRCLQESSCIRLEST